MIFVTFTVLCALLLFVIVFSKINWAFKIGLIVAVFAFCFLVWSAQDSSQGYPAARPFPNDAQFVSCVVVEPDASHGVDGAIYLWMIPLNRDKGVFAYQASGYEPRAYQEPYDEDLQGICQDAQKAASSGQPVRLSQSKQKSHRKSRGARGAIAERGRYHMYKLPPVVLPQKTHGN